MKYLAILVAAAGLLGAVGSASATHATPAAPGVIVTETKSIPGSTDTVTFTLEGPEVAVQAGCGQVPYQGTVKKENFYQVTLWTWRAYIKVSYCNYKVTGIVYFYQEPIDTCCAWHWEGAVSKQVKPGPPPATTLPATYIEAYIKGHFRACLVTWPVNVCDDDWPWFYGKINGNGVLTAWNWGY